MSDQMSNTMNFDLNLDPYPSSSSEEDERLNRGSVNADDRATFNRLHIMRARETLRLALQQLPMPRYNSLGSTENPVHTNGGEFTIPLPEEVRNSGEERVIKNAKKGDGWLGKGVEEKAGGDVDLDFYNCNICLDVATNPVVTCCGHLFCWSCIYCWLNFHSKTKDCPVCKGDVNSKTVMPIYGRGRVITHEAKEKCNLHIPPRPRANRVESLRQTIERSANITVDELLRHVRNIAPLTGESEPETTNGTTSEMYNLLVRRVLTSRAIRREQNIVISPNEMAAAAAGGGVEVNPPASSFNDDNWLWPVLLQNQSRNQTAAANASNAYSNPVITTDGSIETYLLDHPTDRHPDEPRSSGHRDSFSSVAAVVHSGSGTTPDTAMEIDSMMAFSTSTSARRRGIEGGNGRPSRRRLN